MYNWEHSAKANHKKAKKTGTVVLHKNDAVDTSFDRLLKPIIVQSELFSREETAKDPANAPRAPLMRESTVASLHAMGFTALLPSQAQCYRGIFNRRDVILHSRTGSGKTLAYALPLIERHMILKEIAPGQPAAAAPEAETATVAAAPFMLVFVSTVELAVQTRSVLSTVYPSLRVVVAGFDTVVSDQPVEVLVGTVRAIDELIRGKRLAAAATAAEEREAAAQPMSGTAGKKRGRDEDAEKNSEEEEAEEDDDDAASMASATAAAGIVSAANVRVVVVDEVDATLGPRFSNLGRRMKNLVRAVRRANGSLTAGLLTDYRAHHYVLCGATIPNWVIKAGFLGVKKYYYQLVSVGTEKLPAQIQCMRLRCPTASRLETVAQLLTGERSVPGLVLGRTIVFGTLKAVQTLSQKLAAMTPPSPAPKTAAKKGRKDSAATTELASSSSSSDAPAPRVVRSLTPALQESDRITAIEDFNGRRANVLLCTDIATRGLDFTDVNTVIMLTPPSGNMGAETFVHRAGRTARVGQPGCCLVFYDPKSAVDVGALDAISKAAHVRLQEVELAAQSDAKTAAEGSSSARANAISQRLQLTVRNPFKFKPHLAKVTPPSALAVLKANVDADLFKELKSVEEVAGSAGEVVTFAVSSLDVLQRVREGLRKYNVKEL